MQKLKDEARQKIINEEEAIIRDYYAMLLKKKCNILKEYNKALKRIEGEVSMLDNGEFEIKNSMERDGLSIVFKNLTIK